MSEQIDSSSGPQAQILERRPPFGQIGHFGGHNPHLLRHGNTLHANFLTDLAHHMFDRNAQFRANQEEVQSVGKRPLEASFCRLLVLFFRNSSGALMPR